MGESYLKRRPRDRVNPSLGWKWPGNRMRIEAGNYTA